MRWRRKGRRAPEVLVDDGTLVVVAMAYDVSRGDAAVLAEASAAGYDLARPLYVRHIFTWTDPDAGVKLRAVLELDGWTVHEAGPQGLAAGASKVLTAMSAAQDRARMTGLTTRIPVDYLGWEALAQPLPT